MTEKTSFDPRLTLRHNRQPRVEQGFHPARVELMGDDPSQYGTPMMTFRWRLVGSPTEGTPYTYLWRVPLTETDIHKLTQVHKALGLPTPSLSRLLSVEDKVRPSDYLGKVALIGLKSDQYKRPHRDKTEWRSIITEIRPESAAIRFLAIMPEEPGL